MSDSTLHTALRLMVETNQDLPSLASAAAKSGAIDVLQGMLDAGIVRSSGNRDRDVELFASMLPIVSACPDRAAGRKLVDDVLCALGGLDPDTLAHGFARLRDPDLVASMIDEASHPNAWAHRSEDKTAGRSVLAEMTRLARTHLLETALGILARRNELPLGSFTGKEPGKEPVHTTWFDYVLATRNAVDRTTVTQALSHLMDLHAQGGLPRSWNVAIGKALLQYGRATASINSFGLIQEKEHESAIMRMAQLAAFDHPDEWVELLGIPAVPGQRPFGHHLASIPECEKIGLNVLASATRDGVHPDQVVAALTASAPYTWLTAAIRKNSAGMTRALLECGADPHFKPEADSVAAIDEAKRVGATESTQVLNSWLAMQAVSTVLHGAVVPATKEA